MIINCGWHECARLFKSTGGRKCCSDFCTEQRRKQKMKEATEKKAPESASPEVKFKNTFLLARPLTR